MKKFVLVLLLIGLTTPLMAQDPIELSEVLIGGTNYQYLNQVDHKAAPISVKFLQREAANFKAEGGDMFVDEYGSYTVTFFIPDGKIVAFYDNDGKIVKTIERFKNVQLPEEVRMAVKERYPKWEIVKDVYKVNYTEEDGASKVYVLKLVNGNENKRVKFDEEGNYL